MQELIVPDIRKHHPMWKQVMFRVISIAIVLALFLAHPGLCSEDFARMEFLKGEGAIQKSRFPQAIQHFTNVLAANDKYFLANLERAGALMSIKKYKLAAKDLEAFFRKSPNSKLECAYLRAGECYERLGEFDKAVANLTEAINIHPSQYPAYVSRAHCYNKMGKTELASHDLAVAFKLIDNISNNPIFKESFSVSLAMRRVRPDQSNSAIEKLKDGIKKGIRPDSNNIFLTSLIFYNDAKKVGLDAMHKKNLLDIKGETNEAHLQVHEQTELIKATADDPDSYIKRAEGLQLLKRYPEALEDYKYLIDQFESGSGKVPAGAAEAAYYGRAALFLKLGEYQNAIDSYSKAIEKAENPASIYANRARAYMAAGNRNLALEDLAKSKSISARK